MFEIDPLFKANGLVVTLLLGTLVVFNLAFTVITFKLLRQFRLLRGLHGQYEQLNTALTLLTEATESGFRWTTAELQRVTAIVRRSRWPQDVQRRLEEALTLGKTAQQIAGEEGLPESEVLLRTHLARAKGESVEDKETHIGMV